MMIWKVLLVILLILFLLSLVRLGGSAEYSAAGLMAWVRVGPIPIQVFPVKKKKEKKKKPKKNAKKSEEKKEETDKAKPGGSLALVKRVLPLVGEAAGELKRKIQIDRLFLHFTAASSDPAGAALAFGYSNMAIGMIWPIFEQNFIVKDHRIQTAVDFDAQSPVIYLNVGFSARLGQLVSFGLRFGWKFFKIYRQEKQTGNTKKEAV
jgi:hypothetical protein